VPFSRPYGTLTQCRRYWQQPEVTNIHAYVCWASNPPPEGSSQGCVLPPTGQEEAERTPRTFYNALMSYLNGQQKAGDRVVFGEVFPADGSCTANRNLPQGFDAAWSVLNFNAFSASSLKQRSANAGTVFRLWTAPYEACWGVPSRINPPYDPFR